MRKAALYARVSSELQRKEKTIESQVVELKRKIKEAGDVLVKEYVDNGHSGAYLDRPGLDALREALKTDEFEAVYFHAADRIARDVVHQNIIISELIKYKKRIIINGIDYEENPENKFALTVFGAVAQFERAKLIERTKRGWLHRVRSGILVSQGNDTYGYIYTRKTLTSPPSYAVYEKEAKTVRWLFETYASESMGLCAISRTLEEKNVPTRRNAPQWNVNILRRMIRNESYIGIRYFNRMMRIKEVQADGTQKKTEKTLYRDPSEWIAVKVPSIVSEELFKKANTRLDKSCARYRRPNQTFLLKSLVICGICGRRFASCRGYGKRDVRGEMLVSEWARYRCNRDFSLAQHDLSKFNRCKNASISTHILEEKVFEMIRHTLLDPDKLSLCIGRSEYVTDADTAREMTTIASQIQTLEDKRRAIFRQYAIKELSHEKYLKRNKLVDTKLKRLNKKKTQLVADADERDGISSKSVKQYCASAKARFDQAKDFEAKRKFLTDYIEKIIFNKGKITIVGAALLKEVNFPFKIEEELTKSEVRSMVNKKVWEKKRTKGTTSYRKRAVTRQETEAH